MKIQESVHALGSKYFFLITQINNREKIFTFHSCLSGQLQIRVLNAALQSVAHKSHYQQGHTSHRTET